MKKIVIIILLCTSLVLRSETTYSFEFRDGTKVDGEILYSKIDFFSNIDRMGVHLITKKGLYMHHYPYSRSMSEPYVPRPSYVPAINPYGLPTCLPTRISFLQFSRKTLSNIHGDLDTKLKYSSHKYSIRDRSCMKAAMVEINKAYYWKPRDRHELRSPTDTRAWQRLVEMKFRKELLNGGIAYGKFLTVQ
jgi:hypothetical protein